MNAWHCRVSLSDCKCRMWTSCMHIIVIKRWVNVRPQNIKQKVHTCTTQELCVSGLAKACCTQAGPARAAGHVEMAWTDESQLFWHALLVAPIAVARRDSSPVTGTASQATMTNGTDRLPCSYLYDSRHWIGKYTSSLHPCCCYRGGRLFMDMVHVFNEYPWTRTELTRNKSQKWFMVSSWSKHQAPNACGASHN